MQESFTQSRNELIEQQNNNKLNQLIINENENEKKTLLSEFKSKYIKKF